MRTTLITLTATLYLGIGIPRAAPKLEAFPPDFDFGLTVKDAAISTKIWLKSTGTDTVKITKVSTGCECTTAPLSTKILPPGDSTEVTFRWETERTFGAVKRYPRFYYKDAEEELRVSLKANVLNLHDSTSMAVSVWPFRFEMGSFESVSIDSISFKFINITDKNIIPSPAGELPYQCEIVLPEIIPERNEAWGYIKIKPEYLDQEFDNSLTIKFTHDEKYFVTIPIRRKFYK